MNPGAKVLGICGSDYANAGDDAFMVVLADQMTRVHRAALVRMTSGYLPRGCPEHRCVPIYQDMRQRRGRRLVRLLRYGRGLNAAMLFGGSVLHEDCRYWRESLKFSLLRAINPGLRTGAIGVSIGPLRSRAQRLRLADYLNRMDYVSVRDEPSRQFLEEYKVTCRYERHFDLAALLLDVPGVGRRLETGPNVEEDALVLGVAPCHVQRYRGGDPAVDAERCRKLAAALTEIARHRPLRLRFFEFNGHAQQGDRDAIETIRRQLPQTCPVEIVDYRPDPIRFLDEIGRCRALVAMRLHSAVFAFLRGVPPVVLSYHPKCAGFAAEIGLDGRLSLDADAFEPGELVQAVDDACEREFAPSLTAAEAVASARMHLQRFLCESADG